MKTRQPGRAQRGTASQAFTMIELLTVIAIIAILAAIIFPVFNAVREQARQSNTMSNMHAVYLGARLFYEDEGSYPSVLFGYAETTDPNATPPSPKTRPALPSDANIVPMDQVAEAFVTNSGATNQGLNQGYLYHEQVKDFASFLNSDNLVTNKSAITAVYYPVNSPPSLASGTSVQNGVLQKGVLVTWQQGVNSASGCSTYSDPDLPSASYVGQPKLYYIMDSMDIGPMMDDYGNWVVDSGGNHLYELHYTPDWTHMLGATCDVNGSNQPYVTQLKYHNPPTDRTIITYSTQHVVTAGSPSVIIQLLSGTARKINYEVAFKQLPLNYAP